MAKVKKSPILRLLTGASDWYGEMAHLVEPNKQAWCERWGAIYSRHLFKTPHTNADKFVLWKAMLETCDWVFWLGCDTIITNLTIGPMEFIRSDVDLVISSDVHGIQGDAWFMRRSQTMLDALEWCISNCDDYKNDQYALAVSLERFGLDVLLVPPGRLNAFPNIPFYNHGSNLMAPISSHFWKPGDFVLHLPALSRPERFRLFGKYLMEVVK